jgi:hypothetical protein
MSQEQGGHVVHAIPHRCQQRVFFFVLVPFDISSKVQEACTFLDATSTRCRTQE